MQKQPCRRRPAGSSLTKHLLTVVASVAAFSCSSAQPDDGHDHSHEVEVGRLDEALFTNGDFENGPPDGGVPTGWTLNHYRNNGVDTSQPPTRAKLMLAVGGSAQTQNLFSANGAESQPDSVLGAGASLRWPKFGNYAAYLNMSPGTARNVNGLSQTMVLSVNDVDPYDGKPHVRFAVAPVMQDPGHIASQQPYYFIQLRNVTTDTVLFTDFHVSGEDGVPWKEANSVDYTDWQLKDIAPTSTQASLGDSIELEVIAAGCQQSGHFGRIYVDGVGPTIPGLSVNATAPSAANSNTNITYNLAFQNGGTGAAGNVVVDFNTPPDTTFQSLSAPGAVCTQPNVDAAGLVSCTYGLLEVGASDSLQITVKINSGATGKITAGNYQISAVNAQALLGSTIYTNITSGITYTDVAVTKTNNVGAVDWGQAVTYQIVATNKGPAVVTNGTMVDTLPATLTGATWTCAGTGGATCAASGSGSINDNTVTLPVGESVTYTLNASLVASGADTRLTNTATFTLPGAMADSQSSDNSVADTDPITTTATLSLTKAGTATGTVVSVPGAISCGTACNSQSATFAQGAELILAATPAAGKIFTGWSGGGCTGTGNCSVTLAGSTAVTATFDSPPPCEADTDCSETRYCDGFTETCAPRLPNGTNIPNDTIHDGTCATMGLACASLLCNADKCAKSAGASCSAGSECASNTCTSGVCTKMPNGAACGLDSDCTSNTCRGQHCVPSGGCYSDGDCLNTQFCVRSTYTCTPKLTNGSAIPSDAPHTGMCSDAVAVCQSGLCNTEATTCAGADAGDCTSANECESNTCASSHCVPSSNGCWEDSDCAPGTYCDRSQLTCTAKLPTGASIPNDGLHDGLCAPENHAVCTTGECNATANTCASPTSTPCTDAIQCVTNACSPSLYCVPSMDGCFEDSDCTDTEKYCDHTTLICIAKLESGTLIPNDGLHGASCDDAPAVCRSGACNSVSITCAVADGAACNADDQCVNNACTSDHCVPSSGGCWLDGDCQEGDYCDRTTLQCQTRISDGGQIPMGDGYHPGDCGAAAALCVSGKCNPTTLTCASESNAACSAAAECTNNVCDPNGMCGIANGSAGCTPGNGASMCQSGACAPSNRCVPSGGDGCYLDSDCAANEFCDRASLTCADKLGNGAAIPSDGLHDGRCTQPNAQAVCLSSGCNPTTNTCASNNGTSCGAANECIRNICGSNSLCGYPDGSGPCTQTNAKFVCQSGACSSTGNVCVPALNKSCAADTDCPVDAFCDAVSAVCTPDLADGQAIPSDVLHNGLCNQPNAQAVCTSGHCNRVTNQCAAANGEACTSGAQCSANVCGGNGACGRANGEGLCTSQNAGTVCQSGSCSQDGNCVEAGQCRVDADCLEQDRFCDGTQALCNNRLPQGTPIPDDGDHDGLCPSSGVSPVCSSGSCSTVSNTCVVENGSECEEADECASGICDDGRCVPEADPESCTLGTECRSGQCSDGECEAPPLCANDAECAGNGGFCNTMVGCLPLLPPGAPLPDNRMCDGPNAAAVCESGLCNATTRSCAAALDEACGVAAQCESNICGANGRCGLPNGAGPCTQNDAAALCQSQTCSATRSICIAANGCGADSECGPSEYCNGSSFTCVPTLAPGVLVPDDGLHDGVCSQQSAVVCESGACNPSTNTCAVANGEMCTGPAECASNVCAGDGMCGAPSGTGHCTPGEASQCRSDTCSASSLTCIPAANGCTSSNDCGASQYCHLPTYTCEDRVGDGEPVPSGRVCPASGVTRDCESGLCLQEESRCVAAQGSGCTMDEQCQSGVCGQNNQCGVEEGGACTAQTATRCQSQHCGAGDTCDAPAACENDADCAAEGAYCDGIICHAKMSAGNAIASDSLHDGLCTPENALATCQSGACNDTTNTCAGAVSAPCASASACVSNTCGSDGKCGYDIGEGPCTSLNATTVCRTGLCSVVGVCLPSQTSGCAVDSDCGADTFCDLFQHTCVAKLSDGAALPDDDLHDGNCTLQSGAILCASGTCNPDTDTCARPNGVSCVSATTCISNVCGSNGQCGLAEGDAGCIADTTKCQTNRCSPTQNVCIRADNGCAADADCSSTSYCDPAARICKAKLAAGANLPNDSLHNGTCSGTLAAAVCQSGQCNTQQQTCAAVNGASCSAANQCMSDACGSNGLCGLAVGQSGCTGQNQAQTCQSSYCSASGTCVPPQGCNLDSDCSGDTYCNRAARVCDALLRDGRALPTDALHNGTCSEALAEVVCASGACNSETNTCASENNQGCNDAAQCVSNVCGANRRCGLIDGASACQRDAQCQSGKCQLDTGRCVASEAGCTRDDDCRAEDHCNVALFRCEADLDDGTPLPGDGESGGRCTSAAAILCASGACNPETDECASLGGNECSEDAQCAANRCIDGRCGSPDGTGQCTQQNAATACQSGICQPDLYRCVAMQDGCTGDADCAADSYCDGHSLACVPRLTYGAKLPSDDMHTATCSADVAAAVCESGACNTRTNACALVVGMPCTQAAECASNACLRDTCVAESDAPPYDRLSGGRCSVSWVQAGRFTPTLVLLGLALVVLRRRARRRPKR